MKYFILFVAIAMFSCKKDRSCETCEPSINSEVNATVVYTGPIGADGCEWMIKVGDDFFHPVDLPVDFQQNPLDVKISFKHKTEKFTCGFGGIGMPVIELLSISRQ